MTDDTTRHDQDALAEAISAVYAVRSGAELRWRLAQILASVAAQARQDGFREGWDEAVATFAPPLEKVRAQARRDALEAAVAAVASIAPYGCELRPDGTEDRLTAAWVDGLHDAWSTLCALADPASTEEPS